MRIVLSLLVFNSLMIIISCHSKEPGHNDIIEVMEEYSELQSRIDIDNDKIWVINFWATSCPPCIKEMPHFKELEKAYKGEYLKILLVSLDRVKDLESRVYPFVEKHQIDSEVAVLGDQNYSAWTSEIDTSWYGALPATVIIKGESRKFRFGIYHSYDELEADVKEIAGD